LTLWIAVIAPFGIVVAAADSLQNTAQPPNVPSGLQRNVKALGKRYSKGYERVTLSGSLNRNGQSSAVLTAVYEPSRKVRLQVNGGKTVVYDGSSVKGSSGLSSTDEDMIESLFEDSPDGVFYEVSRARLFRPLMYRARLDDGKAANYTGSYVDIYEMILPIPTRSNNTTRQKHFYFDSSTGLLFKVVYLDATKGGTRVETVFQNWKSVSGTVIPGLITRLENGAAKLTFTVTDVSVGATPNDNSFIVP
jgi:hypothetical protein